MDSFQLNINLSFQQLLEVVVSKDEVINLEIGQRVTLSTKAFSPTIQCQ